MYKRGNTGAVVLLMFAFVAIQYDDDTVPTCSSAYDYVYAMWRSNVHSALSRRRQVTSFTTSFDFIVRPRRTCMVVELTAGIDSREVKVSYILQCKMLTANQL